MKKRILLVDDEPAAATPVQLSLTKAGYAVTTAGSGETALARLDSEEFDLVILDVVMPGMSGYDTCREIRQHPRAKDMPVIFLTSKKGLKDMAEGERSGSDLYLTKPVAPAKLLNMVGLFLSTDVALSRRKT